MRMILGRVGAVAVALGLLFALVSIGRIFENAGADEILVIQSPVKGVLTWHTTPGTKWQGFGTVTTYKKRSIYDFEAPVQFNDGGKGVIYGSVQYDLPLDTENLNELHSRFGSMEAIQQQVMEVVTDKVIYMTGPTMSSRESYAEKRNYLINYVQDQIDNGVYQTRQATREEKDQFTGDMKSVTFAEIVLGQDGRPLRQEQSVVGEFGIRAFNFSISQIDYDDIVEKQIADQQNIVMAVQTSIADAQKAQQYRITIQQQGLAAVAEEEAKQNVLKTQQTVQAQARLEVAQKDNEIAEQYRQATLKRADADATARRRLMEADGALQQKLDAYIKVNDRYATAIEKHQGAWVPSIVMGGGSGGNGAVSIIDLLTAKTARDLAIDATPGTPAR